MAFFHVSTFILQLQAASSEAAFSYANEPGTLADGFHNCRSLGEVIIDIGHALVV